MNGTKQIYTAKKEIKALRMIEVSWKGFKAA